MLLALGALGIFAERAVGPSLDVGSGASQSILLIAGASSSNFAPVNSPPGTRPAFSIVFFHSAFRRPRSLGVGPENGQGHSAGAACRRAASPPSPRRWQSPCHLTSDDGDSPVQRFAR